MRSRIAAAVLDQIRSGDIRQVLAAYGGEVRGKAWRCPLNDDRRPPAGKWRNRFRCFACNLTLDNIAMIEKLDGSSFLEAVSKAASIFGFTVSTEAVQSSAAWRKAQSEGEALYNWREDRLEAIWS